MLPHRLRAAALQIAALMCVAEASPGRALRRENAAPNNPETRATAFPSALSPAECEAVRQLDGRSEEGQLIVGGSTVARSFRSTELRWLPQSTETQWLYDRMQLIAHEANSVGPDGEEAWGYGPLAHLEELQLGVYDSAADPPGFYDWHSDQRWTSVIERPKHVRIVSMSVQLSAEADYDGGHLQIGLVNASRALGTAIAFPSFQLHKVHPVTRGRRLSLVAWMRGSDPDRFWQHTAGSLLDTLKLPENELPVQLKLRAAQAMGAIEIKVGMFAAALTVR